MIAEYEDIPRAQKDNWWKLFSTQVSWTFQICFFAQLEAQSGPGQDGQTHCQLH